MKPKIFISHSTKTEESRQFLLSIQLSLQDEFDILLDINGLRVGDDWRQTLYQWMEQAHGAILLLTGAAIESSFVPIEASILSWRHCRDPNFAFLPVLVDGTDIADLKRRKIFKSLALEVFQVERVDTSDTQLAIDAIRQALSRFRDRFPHPKTPVEKLEYLIYTVLERSKVTQSSLEEIGREVFMWPQASSGNASTVFSKFAHSLLETKRATAFDALTRLTDTLVFQGAETLLNAIAPTWIESDRATPIAEIVFSEPTERQLLLDTDERFIVDLYICRARCRPYPQKHQIIQITCPYRQDTVQDIAEQIVSEFSRRGLGKERIKHMLNECELQNMPVYLLFPIDFVPDQSVIDALRDKFQTLTFFIRTRQADHELVESLRKKGKKLEGLDKEEEDNIISDFYILQDYTKSN